jgi:hypothetical protein
LAGNPAGVSGFNDVPPDAWYHGPVAWAAENGILDSINLSKQDRQLKSIRNNPKNVKFETIRNILIRYGFHESSPGSGNT